MSADLADIQSLYDSPLFKVACQDVARIVSILSIESQDFTVPRSKNGILMNIREKMTFFGRFFFMVFIKGFTPTVFDMLPYYVWLALTMAIYLYRLIVLPFWLRLTGYGKYASWTLPPLGSKQPLLGDVDKFALPYKLKTSLSSENPLNDTFFGDLEFEKLICCLYEKGTHLSPHTRSPGHPFVAGFPGNFMNHLTGVYKILVAWGQPAYVARAGMFHSVYGTFDYRSGIFDLRDGRQPLATIIGDGAEELAFVICTSDRIGLVNDLAIAMYGKGAKSHLDNQSPDAIDGNPYPKLLCTLPSEGFPVRNHITQAIHIMPADLFAQFVVVFVADFMDQGALGIGSGDMDICLFQFLRFRFFNDLLHFVRPYLRIMPPIFEKYMGSHEFVELNRNEIIFLKNIWCHKIYKALRIACPSPYVEGSVGVTRNVIAASTITGTVNVSKIEQTKLVAMLMKCPYLAEPRIALACSLNPSEAIQVS